ncbi:DMT family transporter [Geminisphaera colitermitum]|uniref:DMT family transporter n=1 Tax=Geminisphaera colitermitum TaxID=1148786 RepID=UPI000158D56B|nr:DMT family transporter [Geminisphaera colitermitum]
MSWLLASLLSSFFLGCYDLSIKKSVQGNAVLPVLFIANLCSALVWVALMAGDALLQQAGGGGEGMPVMLRVDALTFAQHLQLLLKSFIVACSWICSYFAVKHLPVSIASPIRATGPMWTLFGALIVLGERLSWTEAAGVLITLLSFLGLSFVGAKEGVDFRRNKWIWFLVFGTLLNAVSALYDKFLLGRAGFSTATVQCWFSIYLAVLFLPLTVAWKMRLWGRNPFFWRWSILLVSAFLLVADFLYFGALRDEEALISVVSSLRRGSVLVAFGGGLLLFGEKNGWQKFPAILGVLTGIVLTIC